MDSPATPRVSSAAPVRQRGMLIIVAAAILLVAMANVWFVSFGTWNTWAPTTDYYHQLATAFAHGSVALLQKVDPAVLALRNPYNPARRGGVQIPLDFSLYQGKYYLYFGPVPAVLLAVFGGLGDPLAGDQVLSFIYITGIGLMQALLLIKIRALFLPSVPPWLLAFCIVFAALICPFPWMLTEARVYEVAGTAAQFFFLAGCYAMLITWTHPARPLIGFVLAGAAWMLSIGSRITQAIPIGMLVLLLGVVWLWRSIRTGQWSDTLRRIIALAVPFIVGFGLLGWYNWVRFGSVFETGFTYEITTPFLQRYIHSLFSPLYVLPNAFDYLVALPHIDPHFPYLQPVRGRGILHFPFLHLPSIYHTRAMTGLLPSVPFLVFAALSMLPWLRSKRGVSDTHDEAAHSPLLKWTIACLWLAFLAGLAVILSYFWVVTRFMADFSAPIVLLSVIGFWLGYTALARHITLRRVYLVFGMALLAASFVISSLLAISMHAGEFQGHNPALWQWLTTVMPG